MQKEQIIINGHEAVDLGLSIKWTTCNIGANTSENIGEKYHWGEIESPTEKSRFYDEEQGFIDYNRQGYKR